MDPGEDTAETMTENSQEQGFERKHDEDLEQLSREKHDMETEYGRQMSRAKEFILSLEGELKREQQMRLRHEEENRKLREKLDYMTSETEGVQTAAALQQAASQEETATMRRQFEEEIASLKHIMEVAASDSKRDAMAQLQSERNSWTQNKQQLESEIANLRGQINFVQSGNQPRYMVSDMQRPPPMTTGWQQGPVEPRRTMASPTPQVPPQRTHKTRTTSLEESMRWAQHNTEFMRSIVEPLEEEIAILKTKLREVQEDLDTTEAELASLRAERTASELDKLDLSFPESERGGNFAECDGKVKELEKYLSVEKSSRTDLEMYVAVLDTQKGVLQKEIDKLKEELRHVCRQLEEEKASCDSLKRTWQMANIQFLETQQLHLSEMKKVADILTTEQLEQLGNLKSVLEDIQGRALDSPGVDLASHMQSGNKPSTVLLMGQGQPTINQSVVTAVGGTSGMDSEQAAIRSLASRFRKDEFSVVSQDPSSRRAQSLPVEVVSTSDNLINLESEEPLRPLNNLVGIGDTLLALASGTMNTSGLNEPWTITPSSPPLEAVSPVSLVKSQSTSDLIDNFQERGDSQRSASADSIPQLGDTSPVRGRHKASGKLEHLIPVPLPPEQSITKIVVSEREWLSLQKEVRDSLLKLEQRELLTLNYEDQLQKLQKDLSVLSKASREATNQLRHEVHKLRAQLQREQQLRSQLECSTAGAAQELQTRVTMHCDEHQALQLHVTDLEESYKVIKRESDTQLASLGEDKTKLCAELESGHGQIDALHRELEIIQQAKYVKDTNLVEAESQLQKLRKQVKDIEERLRSENMFLRDQVTSEQFAKDTMEESLQGELSNARGEITVLRHVRAELEREKEQKEKFENEIQQMDQSLRSIRAKSKHTILALQSELEDERKARVKLEEDCRQFHSQIDNLKSQLETSQSVQRDFVQLSQTLQMQLNQMQESRN